MAPAQELTDHRTAPARNMLEVIRSRTPVSIELATPIACGAEEWGQLTKRSARGSATQRRRAAGSLPAGNRRSPWSVGENLGPYLRSASILR